MSLEHKRSPTLIETLNHIFNFTEADLLFNRQGILSDMQKQRMQAKHMDDVSLARLILVSFSIIGLLGSSAAALQEGIPLVQMWSGMALGMLVIGGFIWLMLYYSRTRMRRTIEAANVEWVSGEIFFTERYEGSKMLTRYMVVGNREFSLTSNGFPRMPIHASYHFNQLVTPGQQATVYYTHPWKYVLSVELHTHPKL